MLIWLHKTMQSSGWRATPFHHAFATMGKERGLLPLASGPLVRVGVVPYILPALPSPFVGQQVLVGWWGHIQLLAALSRPWERQSWLHPAVLWRAGLGTEAGAADRLEVVVEDDAYLRRGSCSFLCACSHTHTPPPRQHRQGYAGRGRHKSHSWSLFLVSTGAAFSTVSVVCRAGCPGGSAAFPLLFKGTHFALYLAVGRFVGSRDCLAW